MGEWSLRERRDIDNLKVLATGRESGDSSQNRMSTRSLQQSANADSKRLSFRSPAATRGLTSDWKNDETIPHLLPGR